MDKHAEENQGSNDVSQGLGWEDIPIQLDKLNRLARMLLAAEHNANSISPSGLVNSALRREFEGGAQEEGKVHWENRGHFFSNAYRNMQHALIDHGRARGAQKRDYRRATSMTANELQFENLPHACRNAPEQVEALGIALEELEAKEPDVARVVQHFYFAKLSQAEIAEIMEMSERTVRRHLMEGRLLLHRAIVRLLNEED